MINAVELIKEEKKKLKVQIIKRVLLGTNNYISDNKKKSNIEELDKNYNSINKRDKVHIIYLAR